MKYKFLSALLAALLVLTCFTGCGGTVSKIAGNVADAALAELENQIKQTLEENKLEVKELKTTFGNLNGTGESQFFCAALIKSDSSAIAESTAKTLGKLFTDAGVLEQTGARVESKYLEHKSIEFKHSDFSDGTYFVIFVYHKDLAAGMPTIGK